MLRIKEGGREAILFLMQNYPMKKRLSKRARKRLRELEKLRESRELSFVAASPVMRTAAPRRKSHVLAFISVCLGLFVLAPFKSDMPAPAKLESAAMVENKTGFESVPAADKIEIPDAPVARLEDGRQAVAGAKIEKADQPQPKKIVLASLPSSEKIDVPSLGEGFRAHEEGRSGKIDGLREEIRAIVKNKPIKEMVDDIAQRDRQVAAFLVGIALKESSFGTFSPKNAKGEECYNYWGYRGWENRTQSGYSCFDSPRHAVRVVGDRIESFVRQGRTTPAEMVVWKCGYSCAAFTPESVDSWINDVSINFYKLNKEKTLAEKK